MEDTIKSNQAARPSFVRRWAPLIVMGLAVIIIVLDTTLLNVSLGTIVRELHTNIQSLQWVITAYALTLAALTITGGRFGDLFGRKRMFIYGAVIFAIGSFIASISHNVGTLIVGESIIEGVGAALMMPASASLLVSSYRGRDRALALGVWGGMAAAGSAIGPVIGGYLTSRYSWRWGFRINIFVVALLLIGSVVIKESQDNEEKPMIDWVGVLLTASGLASIVYALIESASYGWWIASSPFMIFNHAFSPFGLSIVPVTFIVGVLLLISFYFWEQRMVNTGKTPLVAMKLFKNKQFTSGAFLTAVMSVGQIGLIFGIPVFLQSVKGLDALHTGYGLLPLSVGLFIMAPLGGYLAKHFKPKKIIQTGLSINIFALLFLRQEISLNGGANRLILPLLIYGMGVGLVFSQVTNITLSAVSVNEAGEASGVNNTLRQVGSSFGTAIVGTVLIAAIGTGLVKGVNSSNLITSEHRTHLSQTIKAQASNVEFGLPLKNETLTDGEIIELKRLSNESTVNGTKLAMLLTAGFTVLALILSYKLLNSDLKDLDRSESLATSAGH